ncbi:lipopolysaccharide biosynthesis protein [Kitasatospora sp. NPDC092948]|uniref:lipopolysaccharide biosynthesis protein n=1 Tax=Kitasatospora sp. NPDC092948 TaxID=3364088 RepID=UPI0037F532F5
MSSPLARLLGALPPGVRAVAGGTVVLGASSYVYLALAGYSLDSSEVAGVSVLWTVLMSVGYGLFTPVELELNRLVSARHVAGEGPLPVVRRVLGLTVAVLAAVLLAIGLAARPIADWLFAGDRGLVAGLGLAMVGLAISSVVRGALAGLGNFRAYGMQLAVDGGLRIGLGALIPLAGLHSALAFSVILVVAPLAASVIGLRSVLGDRRGGSVLGWREVTGGLGLLTGSTLLSQLMVNASVVSVKLLSPDSVALVGALLSAVVLARVPLFAYVAIQASLVSTLSGAAAIGDQAAFRKVLTRTAGIVLGLCVVAGVPTVLLGPRLVQLLFNAQDVLTSADFLWLVLGTACYMLATVLGQALMSLDRHRSQFAAWLAGTAALVAVTLLPGPDAGTRAELGYLFGSLVSAAGMLWLLFRSLAVNARVRLAERKAEDGQTAAVGIPRS